MIEFEKQQDVFEAINSFLEEGRKVVFLHGCNAQGQMGSGVADQVRERWPEVFDFYEKHCESRDPEDLLGSVIWATADDESVEVANAITQKDYGSPSEQHADLEAIEECLDEVDKRYWVDLDAVFVSVRVGCGLGGLEWDDVREKFEQSHLDWNIYYL